MKIARFAFLLLLAVSLPAQQPIRAIKETAPPPAPVPMFHEEFSLWRALANHDLTTLRSLISPDFVYVGDKIENREEVLAGIGSCDPAGFSIIAPKSIAVAQDVAIIIYRATQDLSCGAGHKPGDVNVTSTWAKRDGQWLLQSHTESPSTAPLNPSIEKFFKRQMK